MALNLPLLYFVWAEEYCQTSPNKNKSPNLWRVTSILVCWIFGQQARHWPKQANLNKVAKVSDYIEHFKLDTTCWIFKLRPVNITKFIQSYFCRGLFSDHQKSNNLQCGFYINLRYGSQAVLQARTTTLHW